MYGAVIVNLISEYQNIITLSLEESRSLKLIKRQDKNFFQAYDYDYKMYDLIISMFITMKLFPKIFMHA